MKRKKIYTVIALSLLILLYVAIFCFSAEDGDSSSAISVKVTKMVLHAYYQVLGNGGGGGSKADAVLPLEAVIRKMAHFTEYMCVGFLSYSLIILWYKAAWKGSAVVIVQLFVSALLDEFHQYFIPGRYASIKDVIIDVAGGITGMLFIVAWMGIKMLRQRLADSSQVGLL